MNKVRIEKGYTVSSRRKGTFLIAVRDNDDVMFKLVDGYMMYCNGFWFGFNRINANNTKWSVTELTSGLEIGKAKALDRCESKIFKHIVGLRDILDFKTSEGSYPIRKQRVRTREAYEILDRAEIVKMDSTEDRKKEVCKTFGILLEDVKDWEQLVD